MEQNGVKKWSVFVQVAKLVAYFLLYQFAFMAAGHVLAYLAYDLCVEPVAYEVFSEQPTGQMAGYAASGLAVAMLLSGIAMVAHLLVFKYVHIRRGFLREVKGKVLLLSILIIMCMMFVFNIVAVWLGLENNLQGEIDMMMNSVSGVLSIAVMAPLLEELLFRGAIQGLLMRYFKNPWVGIIVAALVFGVIHANPVQIFYAACLGVGFGWMYYRTGSLLPAIAGHILNNSMAVIVALLWGSEEPDVPAGITGEVVTVLFFSIVALFLVRLMEKRLPPVPSPWHEVSESVWD